MIHAPKTHSRRGPKRRPKHARPSLLAPTRALAILAGFGVLAVAAVAGCAAAQRAADHAVDHRAAGARVAAVHAAAPGARRGDAGAFVRNPAGLAEAAASNAPAGLAGPGRGDA